MDLQVVQTMLSKLYIFIQRILMMLETRFSNVQAVNKCFVGEMYEDSK